MVGEVHACPLTQATAGVLPLTASSGHPGLLPAAASPFSHPGGSSARGLSHPLCPLPARPSQLGSPPGRRWCFQDVVSEHPNGRRRLVGSGASCASAEPAPGKGARRSGQGDTLPPPSHPPSLPQPPRLRDAGAELVGSLPAHDSSQLPPGPFLAQFSATLVGGGDPWRSPGGTRGDAREGSSPGSRRTPPPAAGTPGLGSAPCGAARVPGDERVGWTDDGEQGGGLAGGEGRAGSPAGQDLEPLSGAAACPREAVTGGLLLKLFFIRRETA